MVDARSSAPQPRATRRSAPAFPAHAHPTSPAPLVLPQPGQPITAALVQRMQQTVGNRATRRWLQRQAAPAPVQRHDAMLDEDLSVPTMRWPAGVPLPVQRHDAMLDEDLSVPTMRWSASVPLPVQRDADPVTAAETATAPAVQRAAVVQRRWRPFETGPERIARYEAMAQATQNGFAALWATMRASDNATVRQMGNLYHTGAITASPITRRSDSKTRLQANGEGTDTFAYFFTGLNQNNSRKLHRGLGGMKVGGQVYLRGHDKSNSELSTKKRVDTAVHEAMHIRHSVYVGIDAALQEQYKDEFQAYWAQPHRKWRPGWQFGQAVGVEKARAIRIQLVGANINDMNSYAEYRTPYHDVAHADHAAFKAFVDAYDVPQQLPEGEGDEAFTLAKRISDGAWREAAILQYYGAHQAAIDGAVAANPAYVAGLGRAIDVMLTAAGESARVRAALHI